MRPRASTGWLLAVVLAGCQGQDVLLGDGRDSGRVPIASDAGDAAAVLDATDARDADAPDIDAPDASTRDASLPIVPELGAPRVIAAISGADSTDDDPSLSSDRLLLFFNSKREGGLGREDIWFAARDDAASEWRAPLAVPELNSDARETGIALAADGLQLWWSSDRPGGRAGSTCTARRATHATAPGARPS